jgi:hypothetical protein
MMSITYMNISSEVNKRLPIIILPILTLAVLVGITIPVTLAQEDSFIMTVNFQNIPFGVDKMYVEAKGPFNDNIYQWVANGIDPVAQLTFACRQVL